jgi:hypothetical protein
VSIGKLGLLAVAAAVAAVGCKRGEHAPKNEPRPLRAAAETPTAPVISAGDDEGLSFPIETTRISDPPGRRIRLLLGGGEATLTLTDPASENGVLRFGDGLLQATDRGHGARLVAAMARWLGKIPPAAPDTAGELRPFPIEYARLATRDGWDANKLFLRNGPLEAEVFFNISSDGKQAQFIEKDEDYRRPLLALLAIALRDGKPPRRTSGPDLAGPTPLVASLSPIAGAQNVGTPQAWGGGVWIAVLGRGDKHKILCWNDLTNAPRQLAEVKGSVNRLVPSPKRDRVAVLVLHPQEQGSLSSDDPGDLLIAPIEGGPLVRVASASDDFTPWMFSRFVWSTDGAAIAISGRGPNTPQRRALTRVYDAATGKLIASTAGSEPAGRAPLRWEGDTLVLEEWAKAGRQMWRWRPGSGEPTRDRKAQLGAVRSPDGRYAVAFRETGVDISGPGGRRRFQPRGEADRAAVEALSDGPEDAEWLGGATLVLTTDAAMALDLATGKMRYLFPTDDVKFVSASADGIVIARDDAARFLWGRVAR